MKSRKIYNSGLHTERFSGINRTNPIHPKACNQRASMEICMIKPRKINSVILTVRDIDKSFEWYSTHFGFKKVCHVPGGLLISARGVELILADAAACQNGQDRQDIAIRLFGFEVTQTDLDTVRREFAPAAELVRIDHPHYKSCIIQDPDGHTIELSINNT